MSQVSTSVTSGEALNQETRPTKIRGVDPASNQRDNDLNLLLGRIVIHYKVLSRDKVKNALSTWQAVAGQQDFGDFLVAENYLDATTLSKLIHARDSYLQQQPEPQAPVTRASESRLTVAPGAPVMNGQEHEPASKPVKVVPPVIKHVATQETAAEQPDQPKEPDLLTYGPDVTLWNLLQQAIELNASDLHVHSGATLRVRLDGKIRDATSAVLTPQECERLIESVLSKQQRKCLKENFQIDFAYEIPGVGRFRANAYRQRRGVDAVFRTIKPKPPTLAELGLPKDLQRYTEMHQGLVLFTGPAGCGKSSTLAAMVNLINESRTDHILTIEDPVEYVHPSKSCSVNQREAGIHTDSFSKALRAALREDPDVIVIGELRDLETISLALTAAETGHLVMGTLHTSNAIRTVNRLLGVFPPDQQAQIRMMLSESLKVVISQRLIHRADGRGRVAALEVMINNQAIGNLIRENRTFQIKSIMQTGGAQGQQLLDASLAKLLKNNVITKEEAIRHAEEPDNFT